MKTTDPVIFRIDVPKGCRRPQIHCPICGQLASVNDYKMFVPCQHLVCACIESDGSWGYISPGFRGRMFQVDHRQHPSDNAAMLRENGYGSELLAIEVSYFLRSDQKYHVDLYAFHHPIEFQIS